jgi:hypothetical protein
MPHAQVAARIRQTLDAAETVEAEPQRWQRPVKRGKDLLTKVFPQVKEVVPGILPVGSIILASSPKLGKSRFMLDVSIAVAKGGKALGGIDVEQGEVLYLCLEDSEQLLQDRLRDMLQEESMPDGFYYADEWRRFDEGGLEDIDEWLQGHPNAKLVVVDIFQRVKALGRGNRNAYEVDYAAAAGVLDLSKKYLNVAIVIVHHTNKARDVQDPFDLISGSKGLFGGVDGGMLMKAVHGSPGEATLEVSHRRLKVSPPKMALKTDNVTGGWMLLGDAKRALLTGTRQKIVELLQSHKTPMSPKLIAEYLEKPYGSIKEMLSQMAKAGQVIAVGRGSYTLPSLLNAPDHADHWGYVREGQAMLGDHADLLTINKQREKSIRSGRSVQSTGTPPDIDQDIADVFGAVDVTPLDDIPPGDMLHVPRDATAGISPAQHEADLTGRVTQMAAAVRPKPSLSPGSGVDTSQRATPLPKQPDVPAKQIDVDKPLAATAESSRTKASGHNKHPWPFGHWKAKSSPPSDEPPALSDAYGDAMGEQVDDTEEEVF